MLGYPAYFYMIKKIGTKHDNNKLRFDLIPPEALEELSKVLGFGAIKYADRDWENGMSWGRVYAALQRHLWSWWKGDNKDSESSFSHLSHALCCLSFLVSYEQRRIGKDDRNKVKIRKYKKR